ncbi:MAG: hypothetical protein Fur0012_11640 [Elusimicrobiota bacterium]
MKFFNFCFLLFTLAANMLFAEDPAKVLSEALNSWKDGRYEDAIESYKYLIYISTGEKELISYTRDLSILLNDTARSATAKIYIEKLEAAGLEDPYLKYEKGLALYGMKKFPEAKKAFEEVPLSSAQEDLVYNARFMSAMTEIELGGPLKAVEQFQTVYQKYPYLLAPASYMIADCYEKAKKRSISVNFLKETLLYDSLNIQALIKLARIYEDTSYYMPAWQSYYTLSEVDPDNRFFIKAKKRLLKYVAREKRPDNLLYWVRLAWPVHNSRISWPEGKKIKVGIFSTPSIHQETQGFNFISNSDFEINDSKLGKVYSGKKNFQYSMNYVAKDRIFELRDNSGARVYTTRQNFSINPKDRKEVILIKTPVFEQEAPGINKSDRELTGDIEISLSTSGMKLINDTYCEHLLGGILSRMDVPKENPEFLKALAVVLRTALEDYLKKPVSSKYDICDSKECLEYIGLQFENPAVIKAINDTEKQILTGGYGEKISFHESCGGKTFSGTDDGDRRVISYTPFGLELFFRTAPDQQMYCLPEDSTLFSKSFWTVLLEPYWIEERINPRYPVGQIKNIFILKRDSQMRPISIKIVGTASDAIIEGKKEVNWILSGGNFRSEKFSLRPLLKGDRAVYFIVRGIGTGNLEEFCVSGAYGLAKHHGFSFDRILSHYFPQSKILGFRNAPEEKNKKSSKKK